MADVRRLPLTSFCLCVLLLLPAHETKPAAYSSRFNKTCRYSAQNVSAALFEDGIDGDNAYIMPLEASMVVETYLKPYEACFGPGEAVDVTLLQNGKKLPCFYKGNEWGNYDYWEENACDILIRSNCYCFAIGRYEGSYCEPGLGGTGKALQLPVTDCTAAVQGVIADGGKLVDRQTVYTKEPKGHYIALAVKPSEGVSGTGDFHLWRLDSDKNWSYKAGDTLSRNTYRDGTPLTDVEVPAARGQYTHFCGYFDVDPETHKLRGNSYYFSNLPARFKLWRDVFVQGHVVGLSAITPAWLAAYRSYFADAGWEDGLDSSPKEAARLPTIRHPHTYSVRPMDS
eukprot:GHRR01006301.1.p1 GENE.GHRR01006301.1~~GHRR01006301.1.p1  ORF type:complete len:341 (+),score=86.96 GHRR01006301.1:251-1273(+)